MRVISNAHEVSLKLKKYAKRLSSEVLRDSMAASLEEVGNIATGLFMRAPRGGDGGGVAGSIGLSPIDSMVTTRTGRLAGSIAGNWRFSSTRLPSTVEKFLSGDFSSSAEGFEGGKRESIREVKVSSGKFEGIIGSEVEYAAIHEFGGSTGRAKLPERPYLRPAVEEAKPTIFDIFRSAINITFREARI